MNKSPTMIKEKEKRMSSNDETLSTQPGKRETWKQSQLMEDETPSCVIKSIFLFHDGKKEEDNYVCVRLYSATHNSYIKP